MMKKLAAFLAALLCAVLTTALAGARNVYDYDWEYDDYYDCYYLYDPYTGEFAGIEYSDGSVWWVDYETEESYYTEEADEADVPVYDNGSSSVGKSQYDIDTLFLAAPTFTSSNVESWCVELVCELPAKWAPDGCTVERRESLMDSWEVCWSDHYVESNGSTMLCDFQDWDVEPGKTYYYRFRFYKYFDGIKTYVTSAETQAATPPDYIMPYFSGSEVSDTTADISISLDKRWEPSSCTVSRRTSPDGQWTRIGQTTEFTEDIFGECLVAVYSDSKLKPETTYYYLFEVYTKNGGVETLIGTAEAQITTLEKPEDPAMLTPQAHTDSITITAVVDSRWHADGYEVYRYSSKKKKWEKLSESDGLHYYDWNDGVEYYSAEYTDTGLKSTVKYQYMIKLYRDTADGREYFSKLKTSAYTLLPAPKLTLGATAKKSTLKWSKVKGAAGYEVYVLPLDENPDAGYWYDGWYYYDWYDYGVQMTTPAQYDASLSTYNQNYRSSTLRPTDISQFSKKSTVKNGKTSISYTLKSGKVYVYIVRAYKMVGKTKVYGEFSNQETTDSTSALLNGLSLKTKVTVSEYDLGLIKNALKKCVNSKMSNAEKAAAVYDYVHNAAIYEYDFSKIPADPIEAILSSGHGQCYQYAVTYQAMMKYLGFDVKLVSGKTSSGGGHWWCELTCAGTTYMIDPQVGGRFLIRYDRMGAYAVTREKVYD